MSYLGYGEGGLIILVKMEGWSGIWVKFSDLFATYVCQERNEGNNNRYVQIKCQLFVAMYYLVKCVCKQGNVKY